MENLQNRREFIKLAGAIAPALLLGLHSCGPKVNAENIKALKYPSMQIGIDLRTLNDIEGVMKNIGFTGKESKEELLEKLLNQMASEYETGQTVDIDGWILSHTELVLADLHRYD